MSGLEVAGVVLGSLPLIISALEHYSEGISAIKSMHKYEGVFEYLHASFVTNAYIYRNSCEELLSPLALSDAQLYDLLEKFDSKSWEEPKLNASLRDRLGSNYLPFKSSTKQLNKKIMLFAHKLQLEKGYRPSWVSEFGDVDVQVRDKFFKNPLNRIKGGFNSEKYKTLLSSLSDDISLIATLTSGAIALEPLRLERKRKANVEYWIQFRQHAERLYEAFNSRWSSQCACQCPHQANLRLDIRKGHEFDHSPTFKFLFSFDQSISGQSLPWDWRAVEIEPWNVSPPAVPGPGQNRRVVIIHSQSEQKSHWKCVHAAQRIDDLCTALQCSNSICIGVIHDSTSKHHIHSISLPVPTAKDRISLQEVLKRKVTGIQIKEKCSLALTLACTVLYLHDTPWLEQTWSMGDIYILSQSLLADQPYISKTFPPSRPLQSRKQSLRIIKNSIIFALGVALLEISFGNQLFAFETSDDLDNGKRTAWTEYLIADRLADGLPARELPNYSNATRRCIHCNFDTSVYDLNNDGFRERFYQGVVVPLQEDYDYAMKQ